MRHIVLPEKELDENGQLASFAAAEYGDDVLTAVDDLLDDFGLEILQTSAGDTNFWFKVIKRVEAPPASYESKEVNGDPYNLCNTDESFLSWLHDAGWESVEAFKNDTGVEFEEFRGKWFNVTHNRVFTL